MTVDGRITPSTDDQFRITSSLIVPGACLVFFGAIPGGGQLRPDGDAPSSGHSGLVRASSRHSRHQGRALISAPDP
jgi:hypothetical protein